MSELKYAALANELRRSIKEGVYKTGEKLPSENELTVKYGISRQTVRQAMGILENEGLTLRVRGSGTYVKSRAASRVKSHNVAVITTYISEYIFPSILQGIDEILSENRYSSVVAATRNRVDNERRILEQLADKNIDGIIVEGTKTALPNPNIDLYHTLYDMGIPVVFINGFYPELKNPIYVVADDRRGGYDACVYLIKNGYKKIAGIFKSDDIQGHRRYAGFTEAMREYNMEFTDDNILWYTTETCSSIISSSALQTIGDCDAVICYNDEIAINVISILREAGRQIPKDTGVISFDNSKYSNISAVKITSLSNPKEQIGRTAAIKLLNMIDGKTETSTVLSWTLEEKEST